MRAFAYKYAFLALHYAEMDGWVVIYYGEKKLFFCPIRERIGHRTPTRDLFYHRAIYSCVFMFGKIWYDMILV